MVPNIDITCKESSQRLSDSLKKIICGLEKVRDLMSDEYRQVNPLELETAATVALDELEQSAEEFEITARQQEYEVTQLEDNALRALAGQVIAPQLATGTLHQRSRKLICHRLVLPIRQCGLLKAILDKWQKRVYKLTDYITVNNLTNNSDLDTVDFVRYEANCKPFRQLIDDLQLLANSLDGISFVPTRDMFE